MTLKIAAIPQICKLLMIKEFSENNTFLFILYKTTQSNFIPDGMGIIFQIMK